MIIAYPSLAAASDPRYALDQERLITDFLSGGINLIHFGVISKKIWYNDSTWFVIKWMKENCGSIRQIRINSEHPMFRYSDGVKNCTYIKETLINAIPLSLGYSIEEAIVLRYTKKTDLFTLVASKEYRIDAMATDAVMNETLSICHEKQSIFLEGKLIGDHLYASTNVYPTITQLDLSFNCMIRNWDIFNSVSMLFPAVTSLHMNGCTSLFLTELAVITELRGLELAELSLCNMRRVNVPLLMQVLAKVKCSTLLLSGCGLSSMVFEKILRSSDHSFAHIGWCENNEVKLSDMLGSIKQFEARGHSVKSLNLNFTSIYNDLITPTTMRGTAPGKCNLSSLVVNELDVLWLNSCNIKSVQNLLSILQCVPNLTNLLLDNNKISDTFNEDLDPGLTVRYLAISMLPKLVTLNGLNIDCIRQEAELYYVSLTNRGGDHLVLPDIVDRLRKKYDLDACPHVDNTCSAAGAMENTIRRLRGSEYEDLLATQGRHVFVEVGQQVYLVYTLPDMTVLDIKLKFALPDSTAMIEAEFADDSRKLNNGTRLKLIVDKD